MNSRITVRVSLFLLACFVALSPALHAQQSEKTAAPDDVIRITTELIQSPVIVLDKQGNFVSGLTRDQFELTINNHAQPVAFFDEVIAGTPAESVKYEAARKTSAASATASSGTATPAHYGRIVMFLIDDYHLSAESVNRTRSAILNYIDHSLGQNDRALIMSASGQIGFLQQLTDNKDVLRAAINRLKHRDTSTTDETKPPMNAYQAYAIENGDSGALQYFADVLVKDQFSRTAKQRPDLNPGRKIAEADRMGEQSRRQAESSVKNRARNILNRYASFSNSTLAALKQTVASLNQLPGSKLVFFISDGFFLNQQASGEIQKLNEITSGAVRASTVVYAIQSTGLNTAMNDAKAEVRVGYRGDAGGTMVGQDAALQAPLHTVAADTGGRALLNSNSIDTSIRQGLNETSKYYLLAWRPDIDAKRADQFHKVAVRVKDRPEWTVRVQKGYFVASAKKAPTPQPTTKTVSAVTSNPTEQRAEKMRDALSVLYPIRDLPTLVSLSFLNQSAQQAQQQDEKLRAAVTATLPVQDLPSLTNINIPDFRTSSATLTIGTKLSVERLVPQEAAEKQPVVIDLSGVVLNDEGKTVSSFNGQLKFDMSSSNPGQTVSHLDEIKVKPGLYQVRVAARDEKSGLTGSANEWILVPDLAAGKLALSSILIGDAGAADVKTSPDQKAHLSIDHRFTRKGHLRFFTYIYNAARGAAGAPDVSVQLRVSRDDKTLSTSSPIKVSLEGVDDLTRIPYGAQIPLSKLSPGKYSLSVTATDNSTKSSAMQSVKFVVE